MSKFKPGQSGNPNGRPKGKHALSECLRSMGGVNVSRKARNEHLAKAIWALAIDGKAELPGGQVIEIEGFADWFNLVKWLSDRTDGKPYTQIDEDTEARLAALEANLNGKL